MAENLEDANGLEESEINEADMAENREIDSKYRLILIAAQRSKQLQKGAQPKIDANPRKTKPTRIALEEVRSNKVDFEIT